MPSILSKDFSSKILGSEWSFGYNCYEVGHSWTPNCTDAALELSTTAFSNTLPLYALLYTFTQVAIQKRYDLPATWETIKSIFRSSFFIFIQAYNGAAIGCGLRNGFGRFYYRVLVCLPALLSSYMAILIEKPARRQALAFYLVNLASEIVFRMIVTKGYFKPLKHGETFLFALSLSAWYHFIKANGFGHDPVSAAVKLLVGRDEAKSRARLNQDANDNQISDSDKSIPVHEGRSKENLLIKLLPIQIGRHQSCSHGESSCLQYIINPMATRFLIGYTIQSILKLARNPYKLIQSPSTALYESLTSSSSIRFGLFLMSLVSSGRLSSCLLRRYSNSDELWHGTVSGFIAGLSMLLAPSSSLSMYVMWKAVEQYYLQAAKNGNVPFFDFTILSIYSVSAAIILYTFTLEPKYVRPSYMKFLDRVSNHRLHQLNRMVLDVFGTGSSIGYEDFFPDLDPKHMSNQFKELIFNWMIQPYE